MRYPALSVWASVASIFLLNLSLNTLSVGAADAGIGLEFESGEVIFKPVEKCSEKDTVASSQKTIDGRKGDDWELTGDTFEDPGVLSCEYILDGKKIKMGSGRLEKAADEAGKDFVDWMKKNSDKEGDGDGNVVEFEIKDAPCKKWTLDSALDEADAKCEVFSPQITAPIPLEAVYEYFELAFTSTFKKDNSYLMPQGATARRPDPGQLKEKVWVTADFFTARQGGKAPEKDALAFLSLVLTYIKGAEKLDVNQSPKELSTLMPRTDFPTMYGQVKDKLKDQLGGANLYELVKKLVCYQNDPGAQPSKVVPDTRYCGENGEPNGNLDKQEYNIKDSTDGALKQKKFLVSEWVNSIENPSAGTDLISQADAELFKSSVGGLKKTTEKMVGSDREAPIFEFRNLKGRAPGDWGAFGKEVEKQLTDLHKKYH